MFDCDGFSPQLVIPETFAECYTYEMQVLYLLSQIEDLKERLSKLEGGTENVK